MDSCPLLLGLTWVRFKKLNVDDSSLYLRHEGHKMKLKFMTPREVNKDQRRLKEKIEKEGTVKQAIKTVGGRKMKKKKWN